MVEFFKVSIILVWGMLVLSGSAKAAPPSWSVTPSDFEYSLTVTAVLNIDGVFADEAADKVGAFVNGACRGVASPSSFTTSDGKKLVFLQVYSNQINGENITFKLYDASKDVEFEAINTLNFQNDASFGTTNAPYVITTNNNPTSISISSFEIMEGMDIGTVIGIFTASDPDGANANFSYSLVSGTGSDDNSSFSITDSILKSNTVFDHDTKSVYTILVEVNDGKGGVFQQQITIHVVPDPEEFSALNYISPNGDGKNDLWVIKNIEVYVNYSVTIYNDAGVEVFSTTNYQNDWNGVLDGKKLPAGVYYYLVQSADKEIKFNGSITLNR